MFEKNERIVDLPELRWAFECDDPLESEGHNDEVARDRDDDDQTGSCGWSKLDMGVILEAILQSGFVMEWH